MHHDPVDARRRPVSMPIRLAASAALLSLLAGCDGGYQSETGAAGDGLLADRDGAAATLDAEMAEDEGPSEDPTNILDQP